MCVITNLFGDLAGHLLSKVPVLTDSVEQLTSFHHLHDNQEPSSVHKQVILFYFLNAQDVYEFLNFFFFYLGLDSCGNWTLLAYTSKICTMFG